MATEKFLENPIFICGHRKSGTTLMLALLDNISELVTYPSDSGFFYLYYPRYDNDTFSVDEKIGRMVSSVIGMLKSDISLLNAELQEQLSFPFGRFEEAFRQYVKTTDYSPRSMLETLILAFRDVWPVGNRPNGWVEKTTSSEIYTSDIINWFPSAKFIHIIRDPRDNWASLRSGWDQQYSKQNDSLNRLMQSMIDRGRTGMEFARLNDQLYGKGVYKIVRFEDLVSNVESVMADLAEFIGIDFHDNFLKPTICGVPWKGNNFEGKSFTKPSKVNVNRWRERIPSQEAALMEFHFCDLMEYFGYRTEKNAAERCNAAKDHYKWFNFAQIYP